MLEKECFFLRIVTKALKNVIFCYYFDFWQNWNLHQKYFEMQNLELHY